MDFWRPTNWCPKRQSEQHNEQRSLFSRSSNALHQKTPKRGRTTTGKAFNSSDCWACQAATSQPPWYHPQPYHWTSHFLSASFRQVFRSIFGSKIRVKNRPKINAVDSRGYPWPWQRLYDPSAGGRQRPGAGQLDREANRRPEKIQRFFKRIMSPGTAWIWRLRPSKIPKTKKRPSPMAWLPVTEKRECQVSAESMYDKVRDPIEVPCASRVTRPQDNAPTCRRLCEKTRVNLEEKRIKLLTYWPLTYSSIFIHIHPILCSLCFFVARSRFPSAVQVVQVLTGPEVLPSCGTRNWPVQSWWGLLQTSESPEKRPCSCSIHWLPCRCSNGLHSKANINRINGLV